MQHSYSNSSLQKLIFQINESKTLIEMRNVQEFCDVTLVSEDQVLFKAHKVVLASTSTFFRSIFKSHNQVQSMIYMRGVTSVLLESIIDIVYHGKTKVKEGNYIDFTTILNDFKISIHELLKVNDVKRKFSNICNFWNIGFCRDQSGCPHVHPRDECQTHKYGK